MKLVRLAQRQRKKERQEKGALRKKTLFSLVQEFSYQSTFIIIIIIIGVSNNKKLVFLFSNFSLKKLGTLHALVQ